MSSQQSETLDIVTISGIETYPISAEIGLATFTVDIVDKSVIKVSNSALHPSSYLNDDTFIFDSLRGEISRVKAWEHIDKAIPGPYTFNIYLHTPFTGDATAVALRTTSALNITDFHVDMTSGTLNGKTITGVQSFDTPGVKQKPVIINGVATVSTAGF